MSGSYLDMICLEECRKECLEAVRIWDAESAHSIVRSTEN